MSKLELVEPAGKPVHLRMNERAPDRLWLGLRRPSRLCAPPIRRLDG
jgi:hypothetical protein